MREVKSPAGSWACRQCEILVVAGALAIGLATARHGMLGPLDDTLFSYFNNAATPRPLFYYNGWIPLVPELIGYALHRLPLIAQGAAYATAALAIFALMQRELFRLIACFHSPLDAAALSFVIALYFVGFMPTFELLVWSVWPCFIAALAHILRRAANGTPYSVAGFAGTAVAAATNPTGVTLIPLLAMLAAWPGARALRLGHGALAAVLTLAFAATILGRPDGVSYAPSDALAFLAMITARGNAGFIIFALAVLGLGLLAFATIRDHALDTVQRMTLTALVWVGFTSLALFFLSNRPAFVRDIGLRYTVVAIVCALIGLAVLAAVHTTPALRRRAVGVIAVAVVALTLVSAASRARHMAADNWYMLRFLIAAQDFRSSCSGDTGIGRARVIVLCKPVNLTRTGPEAAARRDLYGNRFIAVPQVVQTPGGSNAGSELLAPP